MPTPETDKTFSGSIPKTYETFMVPLIFEPYAADLAERLASRAPARVLELAAGTGVVTRHLASELPSSTVIVATDLNQPMLDHAALLGTARPVEWRQADALALPFADGSFDAVICQFGVMFFPDKPKAYSEARRVLRPGGVFLFNVWDRIEDNELAQVVALALEGLFPNDPPRFITQTPHGYFERETIERDLKQAGFIARPEVITLAKRSRAASPRIPAVAFCEGTPLRNHIEARDASKLHEATDRVQHAIAQRFGDGAVDGKMQAHVVAVAR